MFIFCQLLNYSLTLNFLLACKKGYRGYRSFSFVFFFCMRLCLNVFLSLFFCHCDQWISINDVSISKVKKGPDFRGGIQGKQFQCSTHKLFFFTPEMRTSQIAVKHELNLLCNIVSFEAGVWRECLVFLSLLEGKQSLLNQLRESNSMQMISSS